MKTLAASLIALALAWPAAAEPPDSTPSSPSASAVSGGAVAADAAPKISLRPYFLVTGEEFSARHTFDAAFGSAFQPFYGGGLEVALRDGLFVDFAVSRFRKDGQRAFYFDGQSYGLGIPLTTTVTPIELTAGYRFTRYWRRIIPYAGVGVGDYSYKETSLEAPGSSIVNTDLDTSRVGYLVVGGAEFRLYKWIGLSVDAQYTRISGILGNAGVSQQAGESNLGGTAARVRVIVGR